MSTCVRFQGCELVKSVAEAGFFGEPFSAPTVASSSSVFSVMTASPSASVGGEVSRGRLLP